MTCHLAVTQSGEIPEFMSTSTNMRIGFTAMSTRILTFTVQFPNSHVTSLLPSRHHVHRLPPSHSAREQAVANPAKAPEACSPGSQLEDQRPRLSRKKHEQLLFLADTYRPDLIYDNPQSVNILPVDVTTLPPYSFANEVHLPFVS